MISDRAPPPGWRVVSVAGFRLMGDAREALHNVGMLNATLVRYHARAELPYPHELLRLEELDGSPLSNDQIARRWHQSPYAIPLRLVRYAPLCVEPEVLDFAVIGTRGKRSEFALRVEGIVARLVEDAIIGVSRGQAGLSLDTDEFRSRRRFFSGRIDHAIARWRTLLFSEWWSVGMTVTPLTNIIRTGATGPVRWLSPDRRSCLSG